MKIRNNTIIIRMFLALILLSGCGGKNTNTTEITATTEIITTEGTSTDAETTTEEVILEETKQFDFDKNCEVVDKAKGVYALKLPMTDTIINIANVGDNILIASYNTNGMEPGLYAESGMTYKLQLYSPDTAKVVKEIEIDELNSVNISTCNERVCLVDIDTNKAYLYDEELNLVEERIVPDNMYIAGISDDARYTYGPDREGNTYYYVYDAVDDKQTAIELSGMEGYSASGIIYDDIIVLKQVNGINSRKYFSISENKFVDVDNIKCEYGIRSTKDKYFYVSNTGPKSGIYFGKKDGEDKVLYGIFDDSVVWFPNVDKMSISRIDYDNNKIFITLYDLITGSFCAGYGLDSEQTLENVQVGCFALDTYNVIAVTTNDYIEGKTNIYILDGNVRSNDAANNYEVFSVGEDIVSDYGELAPLRKKADEIGDKYGVDIKIGDQCRFGDAWIYNYILLYDYETIERNLDILDEQLSYYPDEFFKQLLIENDERPTFYFVGDLTKKYDGDYEEVAAFADNNGTFLSVVFDCNDDATGSAIHEITHLINYKLSMIAEFDEYQFQQDWNALNPEGFEWIGSEGYINNSGNSDYLSDGNMYFADYYGMVNIEEDRATLIASACAEYYPFFASDENLDEPVMKKLAYYAKTIRTYFDDSKWPDVLPWEKPLVNCGYEYK